MSFITQPFIEAFNQAAIARADAYGGLTANPTNKSVDDQYDAYRHALLSAKLMILGENIAKIIMDFHELRHPDTASLIQADNMDRYNNNVGREEEKLWLAAFLDGRTTDTLEKWIYDRVVEGKTINSFADTTKKWVESPSVFGIIKDLGNDLFNSAARFIQPRRGDPLTLDLDGDGLETVGIAAGILFDQNGNGVKIGTGWVKPDDGFLVLDRNANGVIDSGRELFGDSTLKSNGQLAADGFDALRDLDGNADGSIDASDAQFDNLRIWRDLNQDGITENGELFTLSQLGIVSINVSSIDHSQTLANGNQIADLGFFTRTDGSTGTAGEVTGNLADINLVQDTFHRQFTTHFDTSAVINLPDMQGSGAVRDLREAASQSPELATTLAQLGANTTYYQLRKATSVVLQQWADNANFSDSFEMAGAQNKDLFFTPPGVNPLDAYNARYATPLFGSYSSISGGSPSGVPLTSSTVDLYNTISAQQANIERMLKTLESFYGRNFVPIVPGTNDSGSTLIAFNVGTPGAADDLTIFTKTPAMYNMEQPRLDLLTQSYNQLFDSVYGTLAMQTRLKPYFDEIALMDTANGFTPDFSGMNALLESHKQASAQNAFGDLLDLQKYAGSDLNPGGWNGLLMLEDMIQSMSINDVYTVLDEMKLSVSGTFNGTGGNDFTFGKEGNDSFRGNDGNDSLFGMGGNDTLTGGAGNDNLTGGSGADTLTGGIGDDIFHVTAAGDSSATAYDVITDMGSGDKIEFTGIAGINKYLGDYSYASSATATVSAIDGNNSVSDQLVFFNDGTNGYLYIKGTGSGISFNGTLIRLDGKTQAPDLVAINSAPTGSVTISGTAEEGKILTASNTLADVDVLGIISYQWQVGGADIIGATVSSYTLTANEVGKTITVIASYTDGHGTAESVSSAPTLAVANVNDAPTGSATSILAAGTEDTTYIVSATNLLTGFTDADGDALSVSGLTASNGSLVANLDGSFTITPTENFNGAITLNYNVIDGNGGSIAVSQSFNLAAVNDAPTGSVTISGTAEEGKILTASNTLTDVDVLGIISYQWQVGGADIIGATVSSYTLTTNEVGKTITVIASYTDGHGTAESLSSAATAVAVAPVDISLTGTSGVDMLTGGLGNDTLNGLAGTDILQGGAGNDLLDGGFGADSMIGGLDNDAYVVDDLGDVVTEQLNEGTDTVLSSISYTLGDDVENLTLTGMTDLNGTGNALDNILTGTSGNNLLDGDSGADTLIGGLGNDTYVAGTGDTVVEAANQGLDTVVSDVTWTLGANLENLTLIGTAAINGRGNSLSNVLTGNSGANVLNGGAGADTMLGGAGDDVYRVDNAGDVVTEQANEGVDRVNSSLTYTLGANVENMTLIGASAINGTGNELANTLTGNSAANVLTGGAGDDLYVVGVGDSIVEQLTEGTDTVQSAVTWTLSANVENLTLTGSTAINGAGNALNNVLLGNSGTNVLDGGAGDDTLNGGSGADALLGGVGNDCYVVDNVGDVVTENVDEGSDTVQSRISYTLVADVENLTLTGTANLTGTGNALDNVLLGTSGNNVLDGGVGADTMIGGVGNDTYVVDNMGDVVTEQVNEGTDTVQSEISYTLGENVENLMLTGTAAINGTGNSGNNVLTGNSGQNVLDGGGGTDRLRGGLGDDTYVIGDTLAVVTENLDEGIDTVQSALTYTLGANVENLTLTGSTAIDGTGNTLNNIITGNEATNVLDGKAGTDSLDGGEGSDVYVISRATDHLAAEIADTGAAGTDEVRFAATSANTLTLFAGDTGIEQVVIGTGSGATAVSTGTTALNVNAAAVGNALTMIGNAGANTLTGTTFADTLDGGAGADTLIGGNGSDSLIGGNGNDILTGGDGSDYFVFNFAANTASNKDTLTDFLSGTDILQFSTAVFSALGSIGSLGAAEFVSGAFTSGQDGTDRIVYNTVTGVVYYDADGSGAGAAVQVALIGVSAPHPALLYTDIQIIA